MRYEDFVRDMLGRGFVEILTTEAGFTELLSLGFTFDDICSVEMDMQCGFGRDEAIAAL